MTGKVQVGVAIAVPTLALVVLGSILWLNRPFQLELAYYRTSLADRTEAQRHNIRQAAKALDRVVIEPGETFSFNQLVGPRTTVRGYREAPAYMERDLVKSIGGGICQVSSTVYNAAALAGLSIVERHPHSKRVASVSPGRDATVWYGMADLKFRNTTLDPIQLFARASNEALLVSVIGRSKADREFYIRTEPLNSMSGVLQFRTVRVITLANQQTGLELLSLDSYLR